MKLIVFDVGGTDIKYCIMDETLERKHFGVIQTPHDTQEHFFTKIKDIYDKLININNTDEELKDVPVSGVAMSLPGFIDSKKGRNNGGGFLKYNIGKSIGPELSKILGLPVILGNDGKCAAMAEVKSGVLKGCDNAAVYIIGTGVGGGLIVNGRLVNGHHFSAGEFSFLKTNNEDWGTLNKMTGFKCSTTGLLKKYRDVACMSKEEIFNGKDFFAKVNAGEEMAINVLDEFTTDVAKSIFNINVLLDLEKVAIGGGISRQPILLKYIRKNIDKVFNTNEFDKSLPKPEIVDCKYLSDANMVGAYMLYKDLTK